VYVDEFLNLKCSDLVSWMGISSCIMPCFEQEENNCEEFVVKVFKFGRAIRKLDRRRVTS